MTTKDIEMIDPGHPEVSPEMHGRGFLTGQAAKKFEEAANTRNGTAFETEVFGAMVYMAMAILDERGVTK